MRTLDTIAQHLVYFVFYSFLGWIWESVFVSLWTEHHLINRAFLNGPYCPIYGCGALVNILLLGKVENSFVLFLLSGFACCLIEYVTSWAMEACFHGRWGDYSGKLLNINGRICLLGFLGFASFSVVLMKLLHPVVLLWRTCFPQNTLRMTAGLFVVMGIMDCIVTLTGFHGFKETLNNSAISSQTYL